MNSTKSESKKELADLHKKMNGSEAVQELKAESPQEKILSSDGKIPDSDQARQHEMHNAYDSKNPER